MKSMYELIDDITDLCIKDDFVKSGLKARTIKSTGLRKKDLQKDGRSI